MALADPPRDGIVTIFIFNFIVFPWDLEKNTQVYIYEAR